MNAPVARSVHHLERDQAGVSTASSSLPGMKWPVEVKRRLDGCVAEVRGDGLRVHASSDQEPGMRLTTLVQHDRIES